MPEGGNGDNPEQWKPTRRGLFKAAALVTTGLALGVSQRDKIFPSSTNQESGTDFIDSIQTTPEEQSVELQKIVTELNDIKGLDLMSEERFKKEDEYVKNANSLQRIDMGFWALGRKVRRAALLEKRFTLRNEGHPSLQKISQEHVNWAKKEKIHPEVLGICLDVQDTARQVIDYLKPTIRDDFNGKNVDEISAETFMLSPGGMARLICEETGEEMNGMNMGFSYIGAGLAKGQYDGIHKNTGPKDLAIVCEKLSEDTGLQFTTDNIQGSQKAQGAGNSGGALGIQMMPDTVLAIYEILKAVPLASGNQIKFNPFDLESSVLGAWVKLAQQTKISLPNGRTDFRYGVYNGNDEHTKLALASWNPDANEIKHIFTSDEMFRKAFPQ